MSQEQSHLTVCDCVMTELLRLVVIYLFLIWQRFKSCVLTFLHKTDIVKSSTFKLSKSELYKFSCKSKLYM